MYYSSISFVFLITCTACAFATADRNPGRSQDELQSSLAGMLEQQLQQGPGGQIEVLQKEVAPDPGPGPESDADGNADAEQTFIVLPRRARFNARLSGRTTAKSCTLTSQCAGQPIPANAHQYCDTKAKTCTFRCNTGYTLSPWTKQCVKNAGTTTTTTKASTSTLKSSSTPAPTQPKLTSQKKGLGYNTALYVKPFSDKHALRWAYNWANSENHGNQPDLASEVEFVPMLWGIDATGWSAAADKAIKAGSKFLLGFNEPDLDSQSNITPTEAARLWKLNMEPFYGRAKLVSPAITNGAPPAMGTGWMEQFFSACTGCHVDAIAIHWYDAAWNTGYFKNYLTDVYNKFRKPIWLTEFAGSGTSAEQVAFLQTVIPWMESQSFVQRYAGFGAFAGDYVTQDGSLTALGKAYADTV